MDNALLTGYLFEKSLASFKQRKAYKVTNQEVKVLLAVSILAKDVAAPTKKIFFLLKDLNHSSNYQYIKQTLNKLVELRLLISHSVGTKGHFRYKLGISGTLLIHDLEKHSISIIKQYN